MGAAAAVELEKPPDASDILGSGSLDFARNEVIRLRTDLGHLASRFGIEAVVYDASDIVRGDDDHEDFMRCVREVAHIRQCLRLNTQTSKRRLRNCGSGSGSSSHIRIEEKKDYSSGSDSDSD